MKEAIFQIYLSIVEEGLRMNPPPVKKKGKRGRVKKSRERNLLERLYEHAKEVVRFLFDPDVPFDNNLAKRDLRMVKTKMKVSGGFRSVKGAEALAIIRSYISTLRKNRKSLFEWLMQAFIGKPWMGDEELLPPPSPHGVRQLV